MKCTIPARLATLAGPLIPVLLPALLPVLLPAQQTFKASWYTDKTLVMLPLHHPSSR